MYKIYQIKFNNGKSYIGLTIRSLATRMYEHRNASSVVGRAMRKYDGEYSVSVLCETECVDDAAALEMGYIREFSTIRPDGYNVTDGGMGVSGANKLPLDDEFMFILRQAGCTHDELSGILGVHPQTVARRLKEYSDTTGIEILRPEHFAQRKRGKAHPRFGYKHTSESKAKISKRRRDRDLAEMLKFDPGYDTIVDTKSVLFEEF